HGPELPPLRDIPERETLRGDDCEPARIRIEADARSLAVEAQGAFLPRVHLSNVHHRFLGPGNSPTVRRQGQRRPLSSLAPRFGEEDPIGSGIPDLQPVEAEERRARTIPGDPEPVTRSKVMAPEVPALLEVEQAGLAAAP